MRRALRSTLMLLGVAAGLSASPALALDKLSVRLDFSPWGVQAAMQLAQNRGWFKEAGLDVDIQDGRGSGNTLQLVNAGQVDVGQIQVGLVPAARTKGALVRSIATFQHKTDLCILIDKDSPMKQVSDLRGKSVVVFAGSPWTPFIDIYLKAGGLTRDDLKLDNVDAAALFGTYTAKRADGMMSTTGSALPVAEAVRPSKCLLASDAGITFPSYGLVAREDVIASKADALKRLIKVEQRAWQDLKANPDDGVQAMIAERPDARLDPKVLLGQIKLTLDYFDSPTTQSKPIGWQSRDDWDAALKSSEAAGLVPAGWKVDDYYTNSLVE